MNNLHDYIEERERERENLNILTLYVMSKKNSFIL